MADDDLIRRGDAIRAAQGNFAATWDAVKNAIAALPPVTDVAGLVEEPISDGRLECDDLCARFMSGEASEKEVVDTIKKIARDNERLAVLLGEAKAAARYSVSAEWAEKMLPADEGVTPAAGAPDDEAEYHIETALAMARVQDRYASKATCRGEQFVFKANAKAQRQIADYIRRMSAIAPVDALVNAQANLIEAYQDIIDYGPLVLAKKDQWARVKEAKERLAAVTKQQTTKETST